MNDAEKWAEIKKAVALYPHRKLEVAVRIVERKAKRAPASVPFWKRVFGGYFNAAGER